MADSNSSFNSAEAYTISDNPQNVAGMFEKQMLDAYAYSKAGYEMNINNDNFYCDGVYMRGFRFIDMKKSIALSKNNAVFAVCNGVGTEGSADEACKLVFSILDKYRNDMCNAGNPHLVEHKITDFINEINTELKQRTEKSRSDYSVKIALAAVSDNVIYSVSTGECVVACKSGGKIRYITKPNGFVVGRMMNAIALPIKKSGYVGGDVLMLFSPGIVRAMSEAAINGVVGKENDAKNIAINIICYALKCGIRDSSTCIAVRNLAKESISKLTCIVASVCGVITLFDIIVILRALIR